MKSIASLIISSSEALTKINPVIEFTTKSHYGGPELIYVGSEV